MRRYSLIKNYTERVAKCRDPKDGKKHKNDNYCYKKVDLSQQIDAISEEAD